MTDIAETRLCTPVPCDEGKQARKRGWYIICERQSEEDKQTAP